MAISARETRGPVMTDVARAAGVSQKTVSRVINGAPYVKPDVRDRVQAAIRELGYRPNVAARALASQRTHIIGVVAVGTPLFGPASRVFSLERAARDHGYEVALASPVDASHDEIRKAIESLLIRGVEGIVLEVTSRDIDIDPDVLQGIPVASNVGQIRGIDSQAVIIVDQVAAGRAATEHLINLGHQTVWHVAGPAEWDAANQRQEGWRDVLTAAGRAVPPVLPGDWSARSGYHLGRILAARDDVTAIWAANDSMAIGIMRALVEAGKSVPGDVSVVGMDDIPEAEFQIVPLTTLQNDHFALSEQVLTSLVGLIEGGDPAPAPIEFSSRLVVRRSSGPPPAYLHPGEPRQHGPASPT